MKRNRYVREFAKKNQEGMQRVNFYNNLPLKIKNATEK